MIAAVLFATFLLSADPALAQSPDPSSAELWTDVGFRLKMSKKVNATFTQLLRFDENVSRHYLVAPELTLGYELMDWWHLQGGCRYEYERDNDAVFQDRYHVFANTSFLTKYRPATLELRIQWQEMFRQEQDNGTPTRHILRTRVKAKLRRVPTVDPYASVEMFQRLDGLDKDISAGTIQKFRIGLGVEWQRGPIKFNTRYYLVLPTHDPQEPSRHVLSLGVRFNLAPWKKNDKDEITLNSRTLK
jgi:hypothetical protein